MKTDNVVFLLALCALIAVPAVSGETVETAPLNPAFLAYADGQDAVQTCGVALSPAVSPHPLTGLRPAPAMPVWSDRSAASVESDSLPAVFDLRDEGRVTPVRDQGNCGSCWAFATYASLESVLLTDTGVAWDFSENNMKNLCSNLYPDGFDFSPCDGGEAFTSVAYLARWSGPVNESEDPYLLPMPSSDSPTDLSPAICVRNVTFLPPRADSLDNGLMKETIRNGGALWASFAVNWSCFSDNYLTYYRPGNGTYTSDGGHAIALVGWDDTYPAANFSVVPPGDGAFIVRNSWGEGVGDGGYFYISYYEPELGRFWKENSSFIGDDVDYCSALFTGAAVDRSAHNYQYDPLGWTTSIGTGDSTTMYGANVFTADGYEDLRSVCFYTREPETDYVVAVFRDVDTPPGNASGPAAWVAGTAALPGYHVVFLPAAVSLSPGRTFSVVLKVAAPTDIHPLVVEMPIRDYSSNATAEPGQSYMSADGDAWDDLTDRFPNTSVCIKAFTTDAFRVPENYPTIGAAVAAAGAGDTVRVESGTYNERVAVNKTIVVRGIDTGAGLPTIDAGGADCGVSIEANGTVFEGFRVVGHGGNASAGTGVCLEGSNITLRDVAVAGNGVGLLIGNVASLTLNNTSMFGNLYNLEYSCLDSSPKNSIDTSNTVDGRPIVYLEDVSGVSIPADAGAVICVNASDVAAGNLFLEHLTYGIVALDTRNLTVANTAFENVTTGVYAIRSEDLSLSENRFGSGVEEGVLLEACSRTEVEGNAFDGVLGIGVVSLWGQDQVISGNTIAGIPSFGIAALGSSDCEFSGNFINSSICGIYILDSSGCTANIFITDNTVIGDPVAGVLISSVENLTVAGNTLNGVAYGIGVLGVNVTLADNQVGYGDGGRGVYLVADNASVTGNRVEGTGMMALLDGSNVSMTGNTFTGTAYPVCLVDDPSAYFSVYLNNFLLDNASDAVPATVDTNAALEMFDSGRICADLSLRPDGSAFEAAADLCGLPALSCGTGNESAVVTWHSPTEEDYRYQGIGHRNFTGNHWGTYNGIDADGDGIGDTPFAIAENETDFYPLTDYFEAYVSPFTDTGDSGSDGEVAAAGNLNAGATATMHFEGSAVTAINVTAARRIDGIMVTIAPASSGPAGLDVPVYQYLVANLTYTTDEAIADAVFTFEVPASWLEEQGLSRGEVLLWRYHDGAWTALPTVGLREDGGQIVYRAVSPGLSYFAVAGGGGAVPPEPIETIPLETVQIHPANAFVSVVAAETEDVPSPAATTPRQSPLWWATLLPAAGAAYVLFRRRS
ncbi:MAG: hypothetical protein PWP08_1332 [Methanofollis sp.]|nr:hypothetical protein [Methanofollis sp.]